MASRNCYYQLCGSASFGDPMSGVFHTRSCGPFPLFSTTSLLLIFSSPAFSVGSLVPPHASSLLGNPLFPDSNSRLVESGPDDSYTSFFLSLTTPYLPSPMMNGITPGTSIRSDLFPLENDRDWQTALLV